MSQITSMHWTHASRLPTLTGERRFAMSEILGHGAYLCLRRSGGSALGRAEAANIAALARRLELQNEFDPAATPPRESIAFLRRLGATADIADDDVLRADAVIHVASKRAEAIAEFCGEASRLLAPAARARVVGGVVRPKSYT